jgi:hypothetical protein
MAGATVALRLVGGDLPLPATTQSDDNGNWTLRVDDRLAFDPDVNGELLITSRQGQRFQKDVVVRLGDATNLGTIPLP